MHEPMQRVLDRFEQLASKASSPFGKMHKIAPYAYIWYPNAMLKSQQQKPIGLTLGAATHGNEVGGIGSLMQIMSSLIQAQLTVPFPVGFFLGNIAGILQQRRFTESDLNRAFGVDLADTYERKRAKELEALLRDSMLLIDFHQTIEPSHQPFFIFPYQKGSFAFASALHESIPIVTHWGGSFSKDGMCTDEFVNFHQGTGITLELGQKGFNLYQSSLGVQVVLSALHYAQKLWQNLSEEPVFRDDQLIYTWRSVIPFVEGYSLREGLFNFQDIEAGQVLGQTPEGPLRAPQAGTLLFPKYLRDPAAPPAKELYRLMKRIKADELGQEGVIFR